MQLRLRRLSIAAVAVVFVETILAAAPPVGWRTDGSGFYPGADPPVEWSPTKNVFWKAKMPGQSNSLPVVTDDRVFICAEPDLLICVNKADGTILWQRHNGYEQLAGPDEWARAQPQLKEAEGIYAEQRAADKEKERLQIRLAEADSAEAEKAIQDRIAEVDAKLKSLDERLKKLPLALQYGRLPTHERMNGYTTATPTTDGRHVWAVFGNAVVACYDIDGERKWMKKLDDLPHAMFGHSASPLLIDGKLVVTIDNVIALDPLTGREIWRSRYGRSWGSAVRAQLGETPVIALANGRFVRAGDGRIIGRAVNLADGSPVVVGRRIYYIQNRGGAIELPETFQLDGTGKLAFKKLWSTDPPGNRFFASPVVHDGLIYTVSDRGVFTVIDAADGRTVYSRRLSFGRGTAYSSVAMAGEYLFVSNYSGRTIVLKAGRSFQEVARNDLHDTLISTPVFDGRRMYVRTFGWLWCIGS